MDLEKEYSNLWSGNPCSQLYAVDTLWIEWNGHRGTKDKNTFSFFYLLGQKDRGIIMPFIMYKYLVLGGPTDMIVGFLFT